MSFWQQCSILPARRYARVLAVPVYVMSSEYPAWLTSNYCEVLQQYADIHALYERASD